MLLLTRKAFVVVVLLGKYQDSEYLKLRHEKAGSLLATGVLQGRGSVFCPRLNKVSMDCVDTLVYSSTQRLHNVL